MIVFDQSAGSTSLANEIRIEPTNQYTDTTLKKFYDFAINLPMAQSWQKITLTYKFGEMLQKLNLLNMFPTTLVKTFPSSKNEIFIPNFHSGSVMFFYEDTPVLPKDIGGALLFFDKLPTNEIKLVYIPVYLLIGLLIMMCSLCFLLALFGQKSFFTDNTLIKSNNLQFTLGNTNPLLGGILVEKRCAYFLVAINFLLLLGVMNVEYGKSLTHLIFSGAQIFSLIVFSYVSFRIFRFGTTHSKSVLLVLLLILGYLTGLLFLKIF